MLIQSDCLEAMKKMESNSVDFIVTDPPYGLNFMGKKWDGEVPSVDIWQEALRVCKPGSMLAAFGGSRTHHHLMVALEKAGWDIRDVIMWVYGSGFPKSHNHFGIPGYGTALKPAYEPIILAMKPCDGTFAKNAEKWGLAGINIDENRIPGTWQEVSPNKGGRASGIMGEKTLHPGGQCHQLGRWPANIIFDEEAAEMLDEQSGILKSGSGDKHGKTQLGGYEGGFKPVVGLRNYEADSGGASRFFYCAKTSPRERNKGLEKMPNKIGGGMCSTVSGDTGSGKITIQKNNHPTVKPIALMKYIIKLLAPPNDPLLLDPFSGSGSTLLAAKELGIRAVGIEKEKEYCEIAEQRLAA